MKQTEIHWNEAEIISARTKEQKKSRFEHIKKEIEVSNFDCLDGADLDYYAAELTDNDVNKKKWSINDVIELNMKQNPEKSRFDYMNCFVGSETDDIIDFF